MRPVLIAFALVGSMFVAVVAALAQSPETGPAVKDKAGAHPMRTEETGTRGPSGGSPETGYHGQRDVTKDAEPGKAKSPEELRKTGQVPEKPTTKNN